MDKGYSVDKLGAVPTPPQVIRYIVHELLDYWEKYREKTQITEKLKVLDPAVGDGRFLIDFDLNFKERANKKDWNELLECYGLDINSKSIELAHNNIEERKDLEFSNISLKVGNALLGFISAPKGWDKSWSKNQLNNSFISSNDLGGIDIQSVEYPFHWFLEWPDVNGFDIILGNPPYGINFLREEKILFRKLYQAIDPEIESYILFIERSVQLLREGGLLGLIIPSNLLSNYRYQCIRQYLLTKVRILKIANIDRQIFPGIHVETCILISQRNSLQKERNTNEIHFEIMKDTSKSPFKALESRIIIQEEIHSNLYKLLLPKPETSINLILEKIEKNSISLHKMVSISRGIELGFNSPHTSERKLDSDFVPLIAGRSIRKFRLTKNIRYIRFNKKNKSIFKDFNLYLQPKLMLRRIGHELIAVYDPDKHFCVCDVYMIILNPNRPASELIYLEALLNSSLMSFYLKQRFTSVKQIFPKIPIRYLKDLPIKIPSSIVKIQQLAKDLHKLPWNIHQANSHQLKPIRELNQEIFRIYAIDKHEQNIIQKLFKNLNSGL